MPIENMQFEDIPSPKTHRWEPQQQQWIQFCLFAFYSDRLFVSHQMSSLQELRVVLLGKTGAGKSSLGNTLIGREAFKVEISFSSVTFRCQWVEEVRFGVHLQVTDTPGVSDTDRKEDEVLKEIGKSIAVAAPGPHVVLMVLRCDKRFTQEEYGAYQTLKRLFGAEICKYMMVVFAGADALGQSQAERDEALTQAIQTAPPTLKEVVEEAGGRYCSVNNLASREERDQQTEVIVKAMLELVAQNSGAHFTNNLCKTVNQQVETVVQERLDTHRDDSHETALRHTRQDIVEDRAEPGFFEKLKKVVGDSLLPVVGQFVATAATMAAKAALSRCSVM